MNKSNDIIKRIYTLIASANMDNDEYAEITDSIRLVIHETIDKVNEKANEIVDDTIKDIINRLDLESDGHNLDKTKLKNKIINLSSELFDIYADNDNKEISSGDLFKYAVTKKIKKTLEEKFSGSETSSEIKVGE